MPETRAKPERQKKRAAWPRTKLTTAVEIRKEIATIYRAGKAGRMSWADCTKATHVLGVLARLIEIGGFEERIAALEIQLAERPPPPRPNGQHVPVSRWS